MKKGESWKKFLTFFVIYSTKSFKSSFLTHYMKHHKLIDWLCCIFFDIMLQLALHFSALWICFSGNRFFLVRLFFKFYSTYWSFDRELSKNIPKKVVWISDINSVWKNWLVEIKTFIVLNVSPIIWPFKPVWIESLREHRGIDAHLRLDYQTWIYLRRVCERAFNFWLYRISNAGSAVWMRVSAPLIIQKCLQGAI